MAATKIKFTAKILNIGTSRGIIIPAAFFAGMIDATGEVDVQISQ